MARDACDENCVTDWLTRVLALAWAEGRRICALDCDTFEEGRALAGRDLSNITLVGQDAAALERVSLRHGREIAVSASDPQAFLRACARRGERYDLAYTTAADTIPDVAALRRLLTALAPVIGPGGEVFLVRACTGVAVSPNGVEATDGHRSRAILLEFAWAQGGTRNQTTRWRADALPMPETRELAILHLARDSS